MQHVSTLNGSHLICLNGDNIQRSSIIGHGHISFLSGQYAPFYIPVGVLRRDLHRL